MPRGHSQRNTKQSEMKEMNTDNELKAQYGTKRPYKVPDGYFDQFHEQLMNSLPEMVPEATPTTKVTLMARIKPWLYMAAMFAGIIFMAQGIMYIQEQSLDSDELVALEELYDDEADHFMSSSLYNEYVLYSYLTTTDYE